ncbi:sodium- and chloride-dependent glycine transporter 1-like [Haliotis rubra]|uniref:sodium- and chloride-dependent glycine transporter 1-like n=1 Tax=Haliotis rubra TaxID=36100 RepID=UPI001EE4FD8C|nr:sodium- and chloride-dependent glycine transporter 1-like [Haliotis rubra]
MAHELQQPIDKVAQDGAGLAFVVYPEVVTKLPISQLWAVLFFAMLVTLGLGTQIATVTTVHTTLKDQFPHLFRGPRTSVYLLFGIALLCFLVGLGFCTQGGMYVLQLFDNYAATYSLLCIGFVECIALAWVYGAERFLTDIESMLGRRPHIIWSYSWKFIAPIALLVILIFTWVDFKRTNYSGELFPVWADVVGWLITLSSVLAIPVIAIFKLIQHQRNNDSTIIQSVKALMKPTSQWGPALKEHRAQRETVSGSLPETYESQVPLTMGSKNSGLANINGQVDSSRC